MELILIVKFNLIQIMSDKYLFEVYDDSMQNGDLVNFAGNNI